MTQTADLARALADASVDALIVVSPGERLPLIAANADAVALLGPAAREGAALHEALPSACEPLRDEVRSVAADGAVREGVLPGRPRLRYRLSRAGDAVALALAEAEPGRVAADEVHRTIVDTMGDGVIVQDAAGAIVAANPAAERMLGMRRDDMLGLSSGDPRWRAIREDGTTVAPGDRPAALALATGRPARDVTVGVETPGGVRWMSVSAEPLIGAGEDAPHGVVVCFTDVTYLKRTQEALERLLESAPDATLGTGPDGLIRLVNRRACELFGYAREELIGMPVERLVPRGEMRGLRSDGSEFPAEISLSSIEDEHGITAIAAVRDLTELRRAQADRDRFFDRSVDLLCTADFSGYLTSVNPAFERVLGWTAEELTSRPFMDFVHPDDYEETLAVMGGLAEGQTIRGFTNRYVHRDGSLRWLIWNSGVDPATGMIYASASDVTARLETESALRRERDRSAGLLASMADGVLVIGADGRIEDVNPRLCEMTGIARDELIGARSPLPHWPEADRARLGELLARCARGVVGEVDVTFRRADGQAIPAIVSAAPVRDAAGEVIGIVETVKDATERQRVDRLKDEFISVVSHELRTPLAAVHGAIDIMAETCRDDLPPPGARLLAIAQRNSGRLVRLINDVLDLERMTAGKERIEPSQASIAAIVGDAIDAVRDMAAEAGVDLDVLGLPGDDAIRCDPGRVVQLLTNLLSNAVKFSPPGARVAVGGERRDREVLLRVQDRGRGIPADQLERVFERFEQVDSSDRRQSGGTGLGLAIARSIAEMHGGRLWAQSEPDRGSTFILALPA